MTDAAHSVLNAALTIFWWSLGITYIVLLLALAAAPLWSERKR